MPRPGSDVATPSGRAAQDPQGAFIRHLDAVAGRYWSGLFWCYDHPDLPRSNNDLEREFSRFKRTERKATGRKSTAGGPLETCAEFLVGAWDTLVATPDLEAYLKTVTPEQLAEALNQMSKLSEGARAKRIINRDPDRFLAEALEAWRNA